MLAHDLRNVLAVLAGWLDVARRAVDDTERRDALLEAAAVIPRIYELLEQVKVLAPTPTPNPKVNDTTGAAIAETLDVPAAVLPQNIQLMRKVAGDLARVPLSAGQINQVLINLLRNACQAMPQGGALVVMAGNVTIEAEAGPNGSPSSRRTGKFVRLSVVDTGCGIPLEVQKVLFEPYSTTKPLGEGTGLGLASVKSLVEGNGGFVTWRTAPGKGTQCNVPTSHRPGRDGGEPDAGLGVEARLVWQHEGERVSRSPFLFRGRVHENAADSSRVVTSAATRILIPVMLRFVRPVHRHAEIRRLLRRELGQFHADFFEVQPGHFFVELLGQAINCDLIGSAVFPEVQLGQDLVGKGVRHDEARMARGAAEIHQAALGEQINAGTAGEGVFVHLRLDVQLLHARCLVQSVHLDFIVEVADVADDGLVLHLRDMLQRNDVAIAGAGDVNVRPAQRLLKRRHFESFHGGLKRVDGIDLGDDDASAETAQGMGRAFADIAVTAHHGDFARHHHVGGALDAVRERLAATIEVVEFRLGDGVVDIDGGDEEPAASSIW